MTQSTGRLLLGELNAAMLNIYILIRPVQLEISYFS